MGKDRCFSKVSSFNEAAWMNNATWGSWFTRLYGLAISRYEWINLPKTVDERFLERCLFWLGCCAFFKDETMGELALPVAAAGPLNIYGYPTSRRAYSFNGYQSQPLDESNSVLIYNNFARTADNLTIQLYAKQISAIERAMTTNVNLTRHSGLVICDEKQRPSLERLLEQWDGNQPFILGNKGLDPNMITYIGTNVPFMGYDLWNLKREVFQECLNFLGVEGNYIDKAERVTATEISSNLGATEANRMSGLLARQQACRYINELMGYDDEHKVDVRFRSDLSLSGLMEGMREIHELIESGGDGNVEVHDGVASVVRTEGEGSGDSSDNLRRDDRERQDGTV